MAGVLVPTVYEGTPRPSWLGRQIEGQQARRCLAGWQMALAGKSVPARTMLSYDAARPSIDRPLLSTGNFLSRDSSRYQRDRVQLMHEGRHIADNIGFAAGLKMLWMTYLFANLSYEPDTGDAGLDADIADYMESWMPQADARLRVPFAPLFGLSFVGGLIDGDAGLVFVDDGDMLRLMPVEADQIGEINSAAVPEANYVAGRFLNPDGTTAGWRIYSRTGDMMYANPQVIPARSFVYLADPRNVSGCRSISCLATLIENLKDKHEAMNNVKAAIKSQTEKAFATYTARGEPPADLEVAPQQSGPGGQRLASYLVHADRAVTEYFGMGEQIVAMENRHMNQEFLNYVKTIDREDCMGVNLPYGFVVDEADAGGAGVRIVAHKTSREFTRMITASIDPALVRIKNTALGYAIEKGDIQPPRAMLKGDKWMLPQYQKGAWMYPPPPTADMQRESDVAIQEVTAGISSRTDEVAPWGRSFRKVVRRLAQEEQMRQEVAKEFDVNPDNIYLVNPQKAVTPIQAATVGVDAGAKPESPKPGKPIKGVVAPEPKPN